MGFYQPWSTDRIGVFLPVTPLHQLLVRELARPLVVTSGNRCDEPIAVGLYIHLCDRHCDLEDRVTSGHSHPESANGR